MISIILPAYNEESNLRTLYERLEAVTSEIKNHEFEFIFVDDCSTDRTPEILQSLHEGDPRVKVIRFARNNGLNAAVAAGLFHCRGDAAIGMATDLQDPPEIIPRLIEKWTEGYKVIWGVRKKREGEKVMTKLLSRTFYIMVNLLTVLKVPSAGADLFLADRAAIEAFNGSPEKHTSVYLLLMWLGFSQISIEYVKKPRHSGTSKWKFSQKVKLAIDCLLSFGSFPGQTMIVIGLATAAAGLLMALFMMFGYADYHGWRIVLAAILAIGGLQILMLALLGEYIWRTFDESRRRPRYVIESFIGLVENDKT